MAWGLYKSHDKLNRVLVLSARVNPYLPRDHAEYLDTLEVTHIRVFFHRRRLYTREVETFNSPFPFPTPESKEELDANKAVMLLAVQAFLALKKGKPMDPVKLTEKVFLRCPFKPHFIGPVEKARVEILRQEKERQKLLKKLSSGGELI
jgi:hypothetical protein